MTVEFAIGHRNIAFPTLWSSKTRVGGCHELVAPADKPIQSQCA